MGIPFAAPEHFFASDNNASVHPDVLDALHRVNHGHVVAYGDDSVTRETERLFDEIFGRPVDTYFVWNGTGANVMALASCLRPAGAVVCTQCAHINVDETGAPERFLGSKLIDVEHVSGKMSPESIHALRQDLGVVHHVQPAVVSITQSTEWGTVYSIDEIGELCEVAHSMDMLVHLDGARISNAVAHLGGGVETLRRMTVETGVDVISFGGTKNGLMYGEAVVYLDRSAARFAPYLRKQATQLPSKVRYIAAQFQAFFANDLWLNNALWANQKALDLYKTLTNGPDGRPLVSVEAPQVNSLYPVLNAPLRDRLRDWSFFYDWDPSREQVRWMTAWDTTDHDIEVFVSGIRHLFDTVADPR
ncbi:MAG: threonine aldolase family protein [Actinomycetota bacterium]